MSPTRHTWILAASILAVFILAITTPFWTKAQTVGQNILIPISDSLSTVGIFLSNLKKVNNLVEENSALSEKLVQYTVDDAKIIMLQRENEELRSLVNLPSLDSYKKIGADVVGSNDDESGLKYYINRGRKDGITVGMAVVAALPRSANLGITGYLAGIISERILLPSAIAR